MGQGRRGDARNDGEDGEERASKPARKPAHKTDPKTAAKATPKPAAPRPPPKPRRPASRRPSRKASARAKASGWGQLRELYDLLSGSLLKVTLFVALWAWGLHLAARAVARLAGTDLPSMWALVGSAVGLHEATVRLVLFAILHGILLWSLGRPLRQAAERLHGLWLRARQQLLAWLGDRLPAWQLPELARQVLRGLSTAAVTALLVAFLLQPTLVPLRLHRQAWIERAANLVDGTASASFADSVVALARRFYAEPELPVGTVSPEDFDKGLDEERIPLMDRWDPYLLQAAGGDRELFAQTKAFMWVESGGRQFALSATGCAGLMQFCASTAQRRPFGSIFGVGRVQACGCADCSVPRSVQIALETQPDAVLTHKDKFPCNLSDARFDAERAIQAGVAYVRELSDRVGGHLPLMYVGYNAGPLVARAIYKKLGPQEEITLDELRPHLATALKPYYGSRATPRANGLLDVHLPKLMAAYERWR